MRKWKKVLKQILTIALTVLLTGTMVDMSTLAVSAAEDTPAVSDEDSSRNVYIIMPSGWTSEEYPFTVYWHTREWDVWGWTETMDTTYTGSQQLTTDYAGEASATDTPVIYKIELPADMKVLQVEGGGCAIGQFTLSEDNVYYFDGSEMSSFSWAEADISSLTVYESSSYVDFTIAENTNAVVVNMDYLGAGICTNYGNIVAGNYNHVENYGTISSGIFTFFVYNYGIINGGDFSGSDTVIYNRGDK